MRTNQFTPGQNKGWQMGSDIISSLFVKNSGDLDERWNAEKSDVEACVKNSIWSTFDIFL